MKFSKNQLKEVRYFAEYILALLLYAIILPFSIKNKGNIGEFCGKFIMFPFVLFVKRKRLQILFKNFEIVCGKIPDERKKIMAQKYCSNVARMFFESIGTSMMTKQWLKQNVITENLENLVSAYNKGEKIIIVSAHIGNWEIAHKYLCEVYNMKTAVLYRRQNNIKISDLFYTTHQNYTQMIEKRDPSALKKMLQSLKENKVIVVLLDQKDNTNGSPVRFFNHDVNFPKAIVRLAVKNNAQIHCGQCYRLESDSSKFHFKMENPIITDNNSNEQEILQKIFNFIEIWIKEKPLQWFCMIQDMWKK